MISIFANSLQLKSISSSVLDSFLNEGWFRNGSKIFTTQFLNFNGKIYDAVWLRINLLDFAPSKSQLALLNKNQKFRIQFRKFRITKEKELLYQKYKISTSFNLSTTLSYLLNDNEGNTIFNSYEISIYDGQQLIAFGIYDKGKKNAAGITCIYDPNYKKNSLGKFLILLKIMKLKEEGFHFFYPGYFTPGYTIFDYKLSLSLYQTEFYYVPDKVWKNYVYYKPDLTILEIVKTKLNGLSKVLTENNVKNKLLYYPYFDAAINISFEGLLVMHDPLFILLKNYKHENDYIIVISYDLVHNSYIIYECYVMGFPTIKTEGENFYSQAVLEVNDVLTTFKVLNEEIIRSLRSFCIS